MLKSLFSPILSFMKELKRKSDAIDAVGVVRRSRYDVGLWQEFIEFHVFSSVQGEEMCPENIHGNTLSVHFDRRVRGTSSFLAHEALCSDADNRWYMLRGSPSEYGVLTRINTEKAIKMLQDFEALEALAATVKDH